MKQKRPRLVVFRSGRFIYGQIVDLEGKTILTVSDRKIKEPKSRLERAREVGKLLAKQTLKKKIKQVAFDRRGYKYHGRVKALAEGAREGGLEF
jgi:large subunit ribosomal protein L18